MADILSIAEARVAIGLTSADSSLDDPLTTYNGATTMWINDHIDGPAVVENVATADTNTSTNVVAFQNPTDTIYLALEEAEWLYQLVNIGSTYRRLISDIDRRAGTFRVGGEPITTTNSDAITVGLYADTASVNADIKVAASAYLSWLWRIERGVSSSGFDELAVPFNVPARIYAMLPGRLAPGAV